MALETTMEIEPEPEHLLSRCATVESEVELTRTFKFDEEEASDGEYQYQHPVDCSIEN